MGRAAAAALALLAFLPARAQYPGQVEEKRKDEAGLRAVAVLEWTGPAGKPKTSRLVPVTVFDGEALQDAGIYLARPEPLAVYGGVEYVLEKNGKHVGVFDLQRAGQEEGSWVGFGSWKAIPKPKPAFDAKLAKIDEDDEYSDRPVLHRKQKTGDAPSAGSGSSTRSSAPPVDPDRPTLHKPADETSSADTASAGGAAPDPDRPMLTNPKPRKPAAETGSVESLPNITDPDRPRLLRGKYTSDGPPVAPSLMGLPADMQQMVAVSDPRNRPEHPWDYKWANPADELKMKADLEAIARAALGLNTPSPAPVASAGKSKTTTPATRKKAASKPASAAGEEPAPLRDEQFRVFELAYGAGATLVLTAHTDGPLVQQKFVTLIAKPDLYGNVIVLMKSVTDGAHLDDTPRMKLVDAVDAMADNRAELLFELRGLSQRQFALYRVLRGSAEKIFVTSGGDLGIAAAN
ncbi:MAG: hypothetical protein WCA37_12140 [Terracidiphilus sp.]